MKFSFNAKQTQLRAITNPLHEDEEEAEDDIDPQEELEIRLNEVWVNLYYFTILCLETKRLT